MPMALFPEATGFVGECQTSVDTMLDYSISQHKRFELVIHVQALDQKTFSSKKVEFCKLLSHMLKNVPTEEVRWRQCG